MSEFRIDKGMVMAHDWLERDDLSVFVVAGVPKGFNRKLQETITEEHGEKAVSMRVKDELADWVLTKVRGEYRPSSKRSTASRALWRAFRALAAARYHLRDDPDMSEDVRSLRDQVEAHWMKVTPLNRQTED